MSGHGFDELGAPGATVSALAVDADGTVLAERNPDRAVAPASNVKLVTTALALEELGPDFRFETAVRAAGETVDGRLEGDLRLVGAGAPDFGRGDLRSLAAGVADRVDHVTGDLVLDTGLFEGPQYGPGRTWEDAQFAYGAPTTALSVDGNTVSLRITADGSGDVVATVDPPSPVVDPRVDVTVVEDSAPRDVADRVASTGDGEGPTPSVRADPCDGLVRVEGDLPTGGEFETDVPVRRPVEQVGRVARSALGDAGTTVDGDPVIEAGSRSADERPSRALATVRSAPLSEILRGMNVHSDNVTADTLARVVAAHATGTGSWSAWEDLVDERLAALDVETARIRDGSGLSRYDRLTARGVVALLCHAGEREWSTTFFGSLPTPGAGTLTGRLGDLPVRAKTGTLTGARALSGRIQRDDGPVYFGLFVGGVTRDADRITDRLDAVVRSLADP